MIVKSFITHKVAERFSDCQDRFAVERNAIAVSDGMGETWMQKIWAELLVEKYVNDKDGWSPDHESIKPLCKEWQSRVERLIKCQKEDKRVKENVIYRNERRLIEGDSAGATFAGLRFSGSQWNGIVLGDTCLIEWNGVDAVFHSSQDVEIFDNHPDYFDSSFSRRGKGEPIDVSGTMDDTNSLLLLVSDPFSDFLIRKNKEKCFSEYIQKIEAVENHRDFELLVKDWRDEGMHNDDTTLIFVKYDGDDSLNIVYKEDLRQLIETENASAIDSNTIEDNTVDGKDVESAQE